MENNAHDEKKSPPNENMREFLKGANVMMKDTALDAPEK